MAGDESPYANHLNIGVTLDSSGSDDFLCEETAAGFIAIMAILAPELLGADAIEGEELEAICGAIEDPMSAIRDLPKRMSSRQLKTIG